MLQAIIRFISLLTILVSTAVSLAVNADTGIYFDVLEDGKKTSEAKMLISGNRMRLEQSGDVRTYIIFEASSETFFAVNPVKRSYLIMDNEAMDTVVKTVETAQTQMYLAMQNLAPAQRAQMQAMMQKMMPQAESKKGIRYKVSGKSSKVNGKSCSISEILVKGKRQSEICLIDPAKLKIPNADAQVVFGFQKHILSLVKNIPGMKDEDSYWGDPGVQQIPLRRTLYRKDGKVLIHQIANIVHTALDKKLFIVPPDYSKQEVGLGM